MLASPMITRNIGRRRRYAGLSEMPTPYTVKDPDLFRKVVEELNETVSQYGLPSPRISIVRETKNFDGSTTFEVGPMSFASVELETTYNQRVKKAEREKRSSEQAEKIRRDGNALSYNSQGVESSKHGDIDRAIWYFNEALKVGPSQNIEAQLWANVGIVLEASNRDEVERLQMAVKVYDKALSVNPRRDDILQKRVNAQRKIGHIIKNREVASRIALINFTGPYDHASFNARGLIKLEAGDLDDALDDFESAKARCFALGYLEADEILKRGGFIYDHLCSADRKASPYAFNCGVVHERKSNWVEAVKHYKLARMLSIRGDLQAGLHIRHDVEKALARIESERMKDPTYVAEKQRIAEENRLERERERQKEMLKDAIREALSSEFSDLRHDVRGVGKKVEEVGNKIERSLHWPEEGSIHFYRGFDSEHLGSAYWTRRRI